MKSREIKDLCELKIEAIYDLLKNSNQNTQQHIIKYWNEHILKLKGLE
jgi:hypothetical protein